MIIALKTVDIPPIIITKDASHASGKKEKNINTKTPPKNVKIPLKKSLSIPKKPSGFFPYLDFVDS